MTATETTSPSVRELGERARRASRSLAALPTEAKNRALAEVARALRERAEGILAANREDAEEARATGLPEHLLDRLRLDAGRLEAIARDVEAVAALPDPVGETVETRNLPGGLQVERRRAPLGVIGVVYEARPNVTVDIAALALKSGNAALLRGGKETRRSNAALADVLRAALHSAGLPEDAVQVITDPARERVLELLRLDAFVDVIIPRGGAALHRLCLENATVPVITGGVGVVHLYLDASHALEGADLAGAVRVIHNSKVQKPSACNALDTLLVHAAVAGKALPVIGADLVAAGVELRADEQALDLLSRAGIPAVPAQPEDFDTEFLALTLAVRVVSGFEAALAHIFDHGSGHTEAILTRDPAQAERFLAEVDAGVLMVNVSTRFNDGGQLGLGAEVAVSTQKLHARGPLGLRELTSPKWIVRGEDSVRG